jgi:hypothetical protein
MRQAEDTLAAKRNCCALTSGLWLSHLESLQIGPELRVLLEFFLGVRYPKLEIRRAFGAQRNGIARAFAAATTSDREGEAVE